MQNLKELIENEMGLLELRFSIEKPKVNKQEHMKQIIKDSLEKIALKTIEAIEPDGSSTWDFIVRKNDFLEKEI